MSNLEQGPRQQVAQEHARVDNLVARIDQTIDTKGTNITNPLTEASLALEGDAFMQAAAQVPAIGKRLVEIATQVRPQWETKRQQTGQIDAIAQGVEDGYYGDMGPAVLAKALASVSHDIVITPAQERIPGPQAPQENAEPAQPTEEIPASVVPDNSWLQYVQFHGPPARIVESPSEKPEESPEPTEEADRFDDIPLDVLTPKLRDVVSKVRETTMQDESATISMEQIAEAAQATRGTAKGYVSKINKIWRDMEADVTIASIPQPRTEGQVSGESPMRYRLKRVAKPTETVALQQPSTPAGENGISFRSYDRQMFTHIPASALESGMPATEPTSEEVAPIKEESETTAESEMTTEISREALARMRLQEIGLDTITKTPSEQRFLQALLEKDAGISPRDELTAALGTTDNGLQVTRNRVNSFKLEQYGIVIYSNARTHQPDEPVGFGIDFASDEAYQQARDTYNAAPVEDPATEMHQQELSSGEQQPQVVFDAEPSERQSEEEESHPLLEGIEEMIADYRAEASQRDTEGEK